MIIFLNDDQDKESIEKLMCTDLARDTLGTPHPSSLPQGVREISLDDFSLHFKSESLSSLQTVAESIMIELQKPSEKNVFLATSVSIIPNPIPSLISSPSMDETAQALLDDIFTSLNQADQRIQSTQESIDAIKAETREMLDRLKGLV